MLSRLIVLLLLGVPVLAGTSRAQKHSPIAEQIAKTYGLDSFGQIEAMRYTFNLDLSRKHISRSWVWEPKTGRVSYDGQDKDGKPLKVTYLQSDLYKESDVVKDQVDPAFVNDNYWIIFPFHAYWDSPGADVQDKGMQQFPSGKGSAKAGVGEILFQGRLHAWRYLGPVRRERQPDRVLRLPSWRREEAAAR